MRQVEVLENKGKKMKRKNHGIQGPALFADIIGLLPPTVKEVGLLPTNAKAAQGNAEKAATPAPMQKSVMTGVSSATFLNVSDLAAFNGGQLEKANENCYSAGTIQQIFAEKGKLRIRMYLFISGCGHPPSDWETEANVELIIDLEEHDFAYIGSGDNGGDSRLFLRSKYHLRGGIQTIRIFPPNGKLMETLNIDNVKSMWRHVKSATVPPPRPSGESSLFYRRRKPWQQRGFEEVLSD